MVFHVNPYIPQSMSGEGLQGSSLGILAVNILCPIFCTGKVGKNAVLLLFILFEK